MTSEFKIAVNRLLGVEGGLANEKSDRGGPTAYGISSRWFPRQYAEIMALPDSERRPYAERFYWDEFWQRHNLQSYPLIIATRLLDLSVNAGWGDAVKVLQRALWASTGRELRDDGVIGAQTKRALEICDLGKTLLCYKAEQACHYRMEVLRDPTQIVNLRGWLKRAYSD